LVCGPATMNQPARATFVPLSGERQALKRFPDAPIFLQWTPSHRIIWVRHDRLWEAPFDRTGMLADPKPIGDAAPLYASTSRDGPFLFVPAGALRFRPPNGEDKKIAQPLSYTPPLAEPLLIRNVRIIDGTGGPITGSSDILIEQGRI